MNQAYEELEKTWKQWRDLTVSSWSAMSQQMIESDSVSKAMAASYDWSLEMQRKTRENVQSFLQGIDVPTGADLARLSRQVVAAEGRVLDAEEQIETLRARAESAEADARAARAQVDALTSRLATVEAAVAAFTASGGTSARRRTPKS